MTQAILSRLRFSRDELAQVEALVANHMKFKDVQQMKESTLKRFLRLPDFEEHLEFTGWTACRATSGWKTITWSRRSWGNFRNSI